VVKRYLESARGHRPEELHVPQELHILALVKGEEHYVFLYGEGAESELIQILRQWAADPRLSFSWFDAAVLTARLGTGNEPQHTSPQHRCR